MVKRILIILMLLTAFVCSKTGDSLFTPLKGGTYPVGVDILSEIKPAGLESDILKIKMLENDEAISVDRILEIETREMATFQQGARLGIKNKVPLQKGDVLLLSFFARCVDSANENGNGLIAVEFARSWRERAIRVEHYCDTEWKRYYQRGVVPATFQPGEAELSIITSYRPQTLRIAGVELINFGNQIEIERLPVMPVSYKGIEDNTDWRRQALERIEKYRKSDIEIQVIDSLGNPFKNIDVSIELKRHAFGFGGPYRAALHSEHYSDHEREIFQKNFKLFFNKAVIPNALKWKQYYGDKIQWANEAYRWLSQNDIPVRGHTIIWPGWNYMPGEIRQYESDQQKLRNLCIKRFETIMGDWKGRLVEWDVVNEIYRQHDLMDIFGMDIVIDWFKLARKLDPDTKLYYNDANTIANNQPAHQDHYFQTMQWLLKRGTPVDGMGFQCHVHTLVPPEIIYQRIDRFAQLGPEIQITEFDIQKPDITEEVMAKYTRDFMIVVFSHPKTVGIVTWLAGNALREERFESSKRQCAFLRQDWSIKPNGQAWLDLINKTWHTKENGKTDSRGKFKTRGYKGEYIIILSGEEGTVTSEIRFEEKTEKAIIRFSDE